MARPGISITVSRPQTSPTLIITITHRHRPERTKGIVRGESDWSLHKGVYWWSFRYSPQLTVFSRVFLVCMAGMDPVLWLMKSLTLDDGRWQNENLMTVLASLLLSHIISLLPAQPGRRPAPSFKTRPIVDTLHYGSAWVDRWSQVLL